MYKIKTNTTLSTLFITLFVLFGTSGVSAQILVEDAPTRKTKIGRSAASEYFKKRELAKAAKAEEKEEEEASTYDGDDEGDRVLGLHVGAFINDKAYRWGTENKVEDPGQAMLGVTYRVGEWTKSMDLYFRAELISYEIDNEKPLKLSVMPIVAFPDMRSNFPLYFGVGAGAGIFFDQAGDESDLSFDYAVLVGSRFPSAFDWGGIFVETGLKGMVNLLSSGQQDGVFLSIGAIFKF